MKETRIVTCPIEMRRICENQPVVTREHAIRSVLLQNGVSPAGINAVIARNQKKK